MRYLDFLYKAERGLPMIEAHDEAVERELITNPHKCICAWHVKLFGYPLVMREGEEPVSHSICDDCRLKILEECPHTDDVRWEPMRGQFYCKTCDEFVDLPELQQALNHRPEQDVNYQL